MSIAREPARPNSPDPCPCYSYANSVLQSLYFSAPFRHLVAKAVGSAIATPYTPVPSPPSLSIRLTGGETTLLSTLRDLFCAISSQPRGLGTIAPQAFINQLKCDNEFFRSTLHQDAHEFFNVLINSIAETLEVEERKRAEDEGRPPSMVGTGFAAHARTWVHQLFEGILTNETRCLTCETVTSRDEAFLDLSIDIEQNTSVTACLRQFSASEMLCQRNKFSCDRCCGLQEAEKRMKVKKLPNILALHLKRFKYEESLQRHVKLTCRVVFPFELRLFNTADDIANPDRLYELWAIVVHIGVGPHHGHYITVVKSGKRWIVFDDNNVFPIEQSDIARFFGDTPGQGSGYVLFYQAVD
ncbi:cysteine proteinase, partial [Rhodotorula sp. JG-1b]